jgi:hypothetical protein
MPTLSLKIINIKAISHLGSWNQNLRMPLEIFNLKGIQNGRLTGAGPIESCMY